MSKNTPKLLRKTVLVPIVMFLLWLWNTKKNGIFTEPRAFCEVLKFSPLFWNLDLCLNVNIYFLSSHISFILFLNYFLFSFLFSYVSSGVQITFRNINCSTYEYYSCIFIFFLSAAYIYIFSSVFRWLKKSF